MAVKPVPDVFDPRTQAPLQVRGCPSELRAMLRLRNPSDRRAVVREAILLDEDEKGEPASLRIPTVVLRPGQQAEVPVDLGIDRSTPPGEYRFRIRIGDGVRDVSVTVLEELDLEVRPSRLVIPFTPGATVTKQVVVTNTGNVPLVVDDVGAVVLEDELFECRSLRDALSNLVEQEQIDLDRVLDEVARSTKRVLDQAGLLRVRTVEGPIEILPGDDALVTFEFELPDRLDRHTRYFGRIPLYTVDIDIAIVPGAGPVQAPEPPKKASPKRAPAKKRQTKSGSSAASKPRSSSTRQSAS